MFKRGRLQTDIIRSLYREGNTLQEIGKIFNVSRERIRQIIPKEAKIKFLHNRIQKEKIKVERQQKKLKKFIHGEYSCYYNGCRCNECKYANSKKLTESRIRAKQNKNKNFKHGSSGYHYHGCRCDICKTAATKYKSKIIKLNILSKKQPTKHGINGYRYYGCRCNICKHANSELSKKTYIKARNTAPKIHNRYGYLRHGCKCEICKADYHKYYEERKLAKAK